MSAPVPCDNCGQPGYGRFVEFLPGEWLCRPCMVGLMRHGHRHCHDEPEQCVARVLTPLGECVYSCTGGWSAVEPPACRFDPNGRQCPRPATTLCYVPRVTDPIPCCEPCSRDWCDTVRVISTATTTPEVTS